MTFKNIDAFLVSNFYNILYLTGFRGLNPAEREAWLVIHGKNKYLITDGRHDLKKFHLPHHNLYTLEMTPQKGLLKHLDEIIKKEKIKTLGFEVEDLKYAEYEGLKKKLKGIKLVPVKDYFLKKREIKTDEEITKIKKACEIGDSCLGEIIKTVKIGQTEKELAFKIEFWLKQKGHDISFDPIVAIDANAAIPHYDTRSAGSGQARLKKGSTILFDFGVKYRDYCSDMSRVIFFGRPKTEIVNVYKKLLDAQNETIKRIPQFKKTAEIDKFGRERLTKNGLENFPHSTGHGIGLAVHESPRISQKSDKKILSNQVFTVEPGLYRPRQYGLRIEDMIWVKKSGIEVLTKFPKKLLLIS